MTSASLARSSRLMAAGTILSRLTGFGRIFALAYALGFVGLGDAYNLANVTPNIIYELVLGGLLSGTLVTAFVRQLTRPAEDEVAGDEASDDASDDADGISAVVTVAAVALIVLSLLLFLAAPLVIRLYTLGSDNTDQRAVATSLLRWFAPQVACLGAITVTTALLNARRRFGAPAFSQVAANLTIIAVLLAAPLISDDLDLHGVRAHPSTLALLGLGTTAAYALQALVQVLALRGTGLGLRLRWAPRHPLVGEIARLSGWTVGFTIANQVALWVVLGLASHRPGGVSAWQAGVMFFQLPHAIVTISLAAALQPTLAAAWARADLARFRTDLAWGLRAMAALVVPAAAGYVVLARPLVTLALEHGALEPSAARTTASVLALLALGLPGYSAFLFLMRAFLAQQDGRSVFLLYLIENVVNVIAALALFPRWGVPGLAAAYALAYSVGAVCAAVRMAARLAGGAPAPLGDALARIGLASVVMAGVVAAVSALVGGDSGPQLALRVLAATGAGVTVYLLLARAMGIDEVGQLVGRSDAVGTTREGGT